MAAPQATTRFNPADDGYTLRVSHYRARSSMVRAEDS